MLVISAFRYRVVVQLNPVLSRRKVKIVCCLVYIVSFIAGYGPTVPLSITDWKDKRLSYDTYHSTYLISCYYTLPTIFMAVIYYKIHRELIKQYYCMKSTCSNPLKKRSPASFNILMSTQNRRVSHILLCTVLCYAVGHIPVTACYIWEITGKHRSSTICVWIAHFAAVVRLAGSHVINPLIYGIFDKRMLASFKICSKRKQKARGTNRSFVQLIKRS